ncbi:unnamed protein product [Protopolystoma xenopodis]|uniref:Uncharacterized protein n=1 Tax=Protopolystoma xenopodis TaxID=117903 RepID=A0A3S5B252_9PLAT|nr:unnamed protein product [Protopolystoma xenopodis]
MSSCLNPQTLLVAASSLCTDTALAALTGMDPGLGDLGMGMLNGPQVSSPQPEPFSAGQPSRPVLAAPATGSAGNSSPGGLAMTGLQGQSLLLGQPASQAQAQPASQAVELLGEPGLIRVPDLERIRNAKKKRVQQLKRWHQYDKLKEKEELRKQRKGLAPETGTGRGEPAKKVRFAQSLILLEAAARGDLDEGKLLLL